jgi:hypothetical protein
MVSGEVLRLDVFGWYRAVAVDVEVVDDWRFDELVASMEKYKLGIRITGVVNES